MNLLPVDSSLFLAYLHENMAKFFENDISSYSKALEWIGLADSMTSIENWMVIFKNSFICLKHIYINTH